MTTNAWENNKSSIYFCILVGGGLIFFTYKLLIPTILGTYALEVTKEEIIDNINNRVIKWNNVKGIRKILLKGSASGVAIDLFDQTELTQQLNFIQRPLCYVTDIFYGTPLTMSFQYISGDNSEILLTLQNCLRTKNNS